MLRICNFFLVIFYLLTVSALSKNNVYIFATIDDQIITNYDIEKESEYLKTLNPSLVNLEDKKILKLAKESLINEIIKKKEIQKIFNMELENSFVNDYLRDLYKKLNFENEDDFKNSLLNSKNYTIEEIKFKLKTEILWNELIYFKYRKQVKIDQKKIEEKINNMDNRKKKEFLLSEIVFKKKANLSYDKLKKEIYKSILEIGFNNTANIYSTSDTAKMGGKIGWIDQNNLSKPILNSIKNLSENQFTDPIQIGNNYLILKIEKIQSREVKINKEQELEKMITFETNKQLNQFSKIFFDKSKINYKINEK